MKTLFPLIISHTDNQLISECELKWFRTRCVWLKKAKFNIDLEAGGAFAKGIQVTREKFYNNELSPKESVDFGYFYVVETLQNHADEMEVDVSEELKNPARMGLALREYFRHFPLEQEEIIPAMREDKSYAIEHTITAELPIIHPELNVPIIFKGKLDMLGVENGRNYVVDEKTTKAIQKNTSVMLQNSGQFLGYAWLAKTKGIKVTEARVRKVAIQVKEIKVQEFPIAITDFALYRWYDQFIRKIKTLVEVYKHAQTTQVVAGNMERLFMPDYEMGCTAFNRPCGYSEACSSEKGFEYLYDIRENGLGFSEFQQLVWEPEQKTNISLNEFRKMLGLD